jgi:hypothetical protein
MEKEETDNIGSTSIIGEKEILKEKDICIKCYLIFNRITTTK